MKKVLKIMLVAFLSPICFGLGLAVLYALQYCFFYLVSEIFG